MRILEYPDSAEITAALARPTDDQATARRAKVADMLAAVRAEGDLAVRRYAQQFDGFAAETFEATDAEFEAAERLVTPALKTAIRQAYDNIRAFHQSQKEESTVVKTMPGVACWRKSVAIEKVGLYVPGGTAPLFSTVLMLGIPAQIAGCTQIVLCTPPQSDGSVHPAVLFSAQLCGIRRVFKIGGVQAIGAMAYGTGQVPQVHKIFGPGNPWVTAAKQLVGLDVVAIDLPAGPSEVCVVADDAADVRFVAADLLSQAEHGADSQVLLISTSGSLMRSIGLELEKQRIDLPRSAFAAQSLKNSTAILVHTLDEAMDIMNRYAPEHLLLQVDQPEYWAEKVVNAGSVFLGHYTPESAGDYASGTNHTLPTGGWARAYAGVSLDSFLKKITFQHITAEGLSGLGPTITTMARSEGLEAHARAVDLRQSTASAG